MIIVETKAKKWGNSLGIIIPKNIVSQEHLKEHSKVRLLLLKDARLSLKDIFGVAKGNLRKPTQQIKDELRAELYD